MMILFIQGPFRMHSEAFFISCIYISSCHLFRKPCNPFSALFRESKTAKCSLSFFSSEQKTQGGLPWDLEANGRSIYLILFIDFQKPQGKPGPGAMWYLKVFSDTIQGGNAFLHIQNYTTLRPVSFNAFASSEVKLS